ncbi:hypothetical protein DMUE_4426, partial [Dictyocoela muelleri]
KKDYKSIYESILSTETMLIENLQREVHNRDLCEYKTPERKDDVYKHQHIRGNKKKYCSYHRTSTHNDEECRRQKGIGSNKNHGNRNEKIMSLQEPHQKSIP